LTYIAGTIEFTQVSERGARVLVSMSEKLRGLATEKEAKGPVDTSLHAAARAAQNTIENHFSIARNNTILGAWGALESCIDDICIIRLSETSGACAEEATRTLKVALGDYLALTPEGRWPWLLEQIKRANSSSLKSGVGQFEATLDAVGLGGSVDSDLRRAMLYTKAMRNVIAHRGGRIDAKFVAECPRFDASEGAVLEMSAEQWLAALSSMFLYVLVVYERVRVASGMEPREIDIPPWIDGLHSLPAHFERKAISGPSVE